MAKSGKDPVGRRGFLKGAAAGAAGAAAAPRVFLAAAALGAAAFTVGAPPAFDHGRLALRRSTARGAAPASRRLR